ncbi:DUF1553 domain-containing protein [Membranihabitans maritimus]|uniref:DUF1553 domain-containing protein n=1 Tax=Membranihabitans maritimus TaxID=2904244 RepID=UPI001F447DA9|nr:DUF1553 domain-containing protein [Membranihabitans maritimus]
MRYGIKWILVCFSIVLLVVVVIISQMPVGEPISYNRDIRPIINDKCISCHGGVKQAGGFSLLFEEEAKAATRSGKPAIIPGKSRKSEMVRRLTHPDPEKRMPLEQEPLNTEEIELISDWIDQGANWEKHWSFIPPDTSIQIPDTKFKDSCINEIDYFVFQKLDELNLKPSSTASKEALLRRLFLDITGLPPNLDDYNNFVTNTDSTAYEDIVDKLLQSSHFGEHWAPMWLDLARYADSKGYEKDLHREIWKYRDWVIKAFNDDMPFDQFTVEQLAGDLLPNPSESQYIATAFHRNSMANDEGGTNDEEFRVAAVLERVGTTYEVWQGVTMECVQCHSHPYDPIKHEEFFTSMAIFNNTEDKDLYNEQPKIFTYDKMDSTQVGEILTWLEVNFDDIERSNSGKSVYDKKQDYLSQIGYRKVEAEEFQDKSTFIELVGHDQKSIWQVQDSSWIMFEDVDLTDVESISFGYASLYGGIIEVRLDEPLGRKIGEVVLNVTDEGFPGNRPLKWEDKRAEIESVSGIYDVYYYFRKDKHFAQDLLRLDWVFYNEQNPLYNQKKSDVIEKINVLQEIEPQQTPILRELPPQARRASHVFQRGDWRKPGDKVQPGIPHSLGEIDSDTINRLSFARWMVSDQNPLTARVFVNRIWEQIFGFGIIESLGDFGSQGIEPTHRELLDWLAIQFRDEYDWSIKALVKKIVMSSAYRQSTSVTEERLEKDPYNKYLSRGARTRLPAEVIRDQALAISGLLNTEMYGPSVMPYQPESIRSFGGDFWTESEGDNRYRRGVYTYWKRTNSYPSMVAFDSPSREVCTSRRIRTNTPLQALVLLNDSVFVEAAGALASRIQNEYPDDIELGIRKVLQLVTAIPPEKEKIDALIVLYREALEYYQRNKMERVKVFHLKENEYMALKLVCNAMFNLDEFVTRS